MWNGGGSEEEKREKKRGRGGEQSEAVKQRGGKGGGEGKKQIWSGILVQLSGHKTRGDPQNENKRAPRNKPLQT